VEQIQELVMLEGLVEGMGVVGQGQPTQELQAKVTPGELGVFIIIVQDQVEAEPVQ
jgi:hypothetical protein